MVKKNNNKYQDNVNTFETLRETPSGTFRWIYSKKVFRVDSVSLS
jgi:hypothetical protein